MVRSADLNRRDRYPVFYGIFGKAISLVSNKYKNPNHPLLKIIKDGREGDWEKELLRAICILKLETLVDFAKTYKLDPADIASREDHFESFMAEIYILFSLNSLGFKNIEKLKAGLEAPSPDYMAEFDRKKFVIEVWGRERKKQENAEENARVALSGGRKGAYNMTELEANLEQCVDRRLDEKYVRQMKAFKGFKKIAAVYNPGRITGTLADRQAVNSIGRRLLKKSKGKIDYFLFRFKFPSLKNDTNTFVIPKLKKKRTS